MQEKILIIDFGSQYTQLIARRVRELNVFCEIIPFQNASKYTEDIKGVILSGSPFSVHDEYAPKIDVSEFSQKVPVLGICYGAQMIADSFSGLVEPANKREYGKAILAHSAKEDLLFNGISENSQVWMSHADSVTELPDTFEIIGTTSDIPIAAFKNKNGAFGNAVYGIQFHPEVTHSLEGKTLLHNFIVDICGCIQDWTPDAFVESTISELQEKLGKDHVLLGLSGGVDSTVAAMLLHHAIGSNLTCVFIDNGVLRKDEYSQVLEAYDGLGLNVIGVDAGDQFLDALEGIEDPETKRKAIGKTFIDVFDEEAKKIKQHDSHVKWLGQGTIYPDVIESVSVHGPSATIKSHHNVGGLPEKMNMKVVEPLKFLFKDEVRRVGKAMNIEDRFLKRHPFPGPGLAIRVIGPISRERVRILQEADAIFIQKLHETGLYDEIWQAGVMLLPIRTVGVMGDERTYEHVASLRAVTSVDGMTAEWAEIPHEVLAEVSNDIINKVKGINRVVYDISSKPPATIEWE